MDHMQTILRNMLLVVLEDLAVRYKCFFTLQVLLSLFSM